MPDFPWRADGAVPPVGDSALDELLTAGQPPEDASGLLPVAAVLAALRAAPADDELAGQARALAQFRSTVRVSHHAGRARSRRPTTPRERLSSKLAVITAAAAVAVTGTVAAAYVDALPAPLQRAAHDMIAAPAAHARAIPAAARARPFHSRSAGAPRRQALGNPGGRHGKPGPAKKHDKRKPPGHRKHHMSDPYARRGEWPAARDGDDEWSAIRYGDWTAARYTDRPAVRRATNRWSITRGSRLRLPLPTAAAFPNPPADPDRPGVGGR